MWTDPSTWPSQSIGLTARPTSWAATTRSTSPVSGSRTTIWAAYPNVEWMIGFSTPSLIEFVQSTRYSPS